MDLTDTQVSRVLAKALDGVSARNLAIASNIANAETPGYQSVTVSFEDNLKQAIEADNNPGQNSPFLPPGTLKTDDPKDINTNPLPSSIAASHAAIERSQFFYRHDQNGVDIENEMAQLAKNTERYLALSKLENKNFSLLDSVIKGG